MKNIILIFILIISSFQTMAQDQRFFSSEQAIEWVPQLIGYNMQIIGEQNDKGIKATEKNQIEFLFYTDTEEKAESLKVAIKDEFEYQLYKIYFLEGYWLITGVTNEMSMEFDSFSKWTYDFCKFGFDYDTKLLNWNIFDKEKANSFDKFWDWFEQHQEEYYNLDYEKMDKLQTSFDKLSRELKSLNSSFTFEFSPILDNAKREFVLSADGDRKAFPDLLYLFKRSPNLKKWEIIPFKQGFDGDPKLEFDNGFKLSWKSVMFKSRETDEGLSIDFYIENYNESDKNIGTGLIILLDSYLGEYDAVMQIRYVDVHKLNKKKTKDLQEFKDLKQVVEEYKLKKWKN